MNGLSWTGGGTIAGLGITGSALGGLTFNGSPHANAAANTVALAFAGITVTLNEQRSSFSGNTLFAQTNAVHIASTIMRWRATCSPAT